MTDVVPPTPEPGGDRFQHLLESLDAIVWEMDAATGRFTYVSPQAERILGYPVRRWYDEPGFWAGRVVHPDDRAAAVASRVSTPDEARDHELDHRAVAADGRVVWLRDVVRVIPGEGGRAGLLRGVMIDVTGQKQAEERLRTGARHAALSADVGAAVARGGTLREVLQRCAEAMVQHLDAAFARIWTLNRAERVLELQASAGMYTHLDGPHGRVPVGTFKIGLIAQEREPHLTNDVLHDPRVGDKEWARREGMVAFAGYPLLVDGEVVGVMAMFARQPLGEATLDALRTVADRVALVVERKRTEAELRDREEQLAEAQRLAHLGSWEWEVAPNRVAWSDELYRIYGLEPQSEACTFESYLARVHPGDRERVRAAIGASYATGEPFDFLERIVRPDGGERVLHSRGGTVRDEGGRVVRLVGTCQDVTEQRAAAERELELAGEQAARRRAEEEERRMALLAEAGVLLASSLDYDTTLGNLARLVVPRIADWCAIDILEGGRVRRVVVAHPDPAREELARELERLYPADPDAPTGVPRVLRTGEPELVAEIPESLLETAARDPEHLRILRELRMRSYMVVPLSARGRTLGAMTLVCAESGNQYGEEDLRFAQELAGRAAMAVDNARLFRDAEQARSQTTQILESITDAFYALDREWRFTYLNRQAEAVLQRPAAELLGRSLWAEFPEAAELSFRPMYERAVSEGRTVQFNEYFPPLEAWFEVRAYPSPGGLAVYFRDVTEEKRAEEALRRSEARYRSLTEATAAIVWDTTASGELGPDQPRWGEFTGQSPDEYQGTGWLEAIHPDDRAHTLESWRLALEDRSPYQVEHRVRRRDGEYRHMQARAVPLLEEDGGVREWVGLHVDLTERRQAEEELEYQSYVTRTITENATAALFMMDDRGRCTYLNPAAERMTGYTLEELRDIALHDAVHHHRPDGTPFPMSECPIDRALPEDFSIRAHEDVFIRKDGTFFPVLVAASPIFRDGDRPVGTVVEVRDVTEERGAQEALRLSEERYRLATRATDDAIWDWDLVTHEVRWNEAIHRVFGYADDAVEETAEWWYEHIHPDDGERVVHGIHAAIDGGAEVWSDEYRYRRADGSYAAVLDRGYVARDPDGRPTRMIGSMADITERKQIEEALRESERQLRFLADTVPVQIWVTRPDGYQEYYNRRWYEYTGTAEEEAPGAGWVHLLHPGDVERARERWEHSLRTGEPYSIEYRFRGADGGYRWFLGQALPQRNEAGEIVRWFGTLTDIQDRKEAETERERLIALLDTERSRLREIFREAPAFIATLRGPEHVFESANPLYMQLVGHRGILGKPVREALPEVVEQGFVDLLDRVYRTGESFVGTEARVWLQREPHGPLEEVFLNFIYQPVREHDGAVSGIFVHAVDVTGQVRARHEVERKADELARLARALEVSNRELDQFAYVASHDLKAPLRGIANLSQWIEEDLGEDVPGEVREHMELLRGRVHRMEGLIDGILQYSRAGRVREKPEAVDTGALLHEVVDLLAPPEEVTIAVAPGMPTLVTERLPMQQVFMNLVGNALKYTRRPDARVEVGAREADGSWEFWVRDNGPGIAPEYHERIFGIFQTLEARDKVEGTGIGLSLVKKIVEARGGQVWVESAEGAGATFRFLWPRTTRTEE